MTLILSGTDGLSDVDGSAATPAIRGTDTNTGIFFGADIIGFSEGGTEVARFNADSQFVAAAGTAALPVVTTTGDTNTGIFFPAADTIAFAEGGVEAMRLDASGNLGLGVTPSAWASFTALQIGETGCVASNAFSATNTQTYLGNNAYYNAGGFRYIATGSATALYNITANEHKWNSAAIGTAGDVIAFTNTMTLDSSGNLLVGTTSFTSGGIQKTIVVSGDSTAGFQLARSGATAAYIYTYGSTGFRVETTSSYAKVEFVPGGSGGVQLASAGATSWTSLSDERTKTDLVPITDAVQKVSSLRAVTGRFIKDAPEKSRSFLIAQDFVDVFPQVISTFKEKDDDTEYLGLAYTEVIPLLTAAIKEQQAIIETLKARLDAANL